MSQENVEIVRAAFEAFNRGDVRRRSPRRRPRISSLTIADGGRSAASSGRSIAVRGI